jgi:hypothetical protein
MTYTGAKSNQKILENVMNKMNWGEDELPFIYINFWKKRDIFDLNTNSEKCLIT